MIDDFYCISLEAESTPAEASESVAALRRATSIYDEHGLLGSTEKDVVGSDRKNRQLGLVTAFGGLGFEFSLQMAAHGHLLRGLPPRTRGLA